ncbi:unnamed protein product [Brassica oleracea var. botrytis]
MEDDINNTNGRIPKPKSSQNFLRSSVSPQSSENNFTPQQTDKRSGVLPLKRVFCRVLSDVTNTNRDTPSEPQSVNLSNRTRPSTSQRLENVNTSGLTWQAYEGRSSINDSNTSSKRRCFDICPTNLLKEFSKTNSTQKHIATRSCRKGQQVSIDETSIVNNSDYLSPFEDQGFQIYDISSEEEETNYEDHSDPETTAQPQEDISVQTVQDDQRAQVLKMATMFQNIFQDKPLKKGWTNIKRQGRKPRVKEESSSKKTEYVDEGDPTFKCEHCGAIMWYGERIEKKKQNKKPKFALCCGQGQVQLPLLKQSPEILKKLHTDNDEISKYYRENIRQINMVFSFTSLGGKIDRSAPQGSGPKMVVLQGENYHLMGSLKPPPGEDPKFGQLYIVDTDNEIQNRSSIIGKYKTKQEKAKKERLRKQVIERLVKMLDEVNPYVHQFRTARERFNTCPEETLHMRIVSSREKDGRTYDTPTASEVAALIPGDFNLDMDKRDIVLEEKQTGFLKRISEIHPSYLALQYPLIFTYGEDGFRLGIKKRTTDATAQHKRQTISMRQWYAFRLHERENECHTLLHSKRLFQQFLVDGYTTIESNRLRYLRLNQKCLRSDSFDSIQQAENEGKIDMHDQGSRYLLPASFTGGPRYMKNMYLDAMAVCKHFGFPDLFITFTCNPKWAEIIRYLEPRKLTADDRPEIICRLFKCKLDSLMMDLTDKQLLGKTVACEFVYFYFFPILL